jgi:hypothetical protein
MERILFYATNTHDYNIENNDSDSGINLALKILNHIKWCEVVYDSNNLVKVLSEKALPALPLMLQIEIITR